MHLPSKELLMSASQRGVINVGAEGEWCSKLNPHEATVVRSKGYGLESLLALLKPARKYLQLFTNHSSFFKITFLASHLTILTEVHICSRTQ